MSAARSDEQELVARANRGDAEALATIYRLHRDWVVGLAWRFTGDRDDALDVMQDSFAALFDAFPGFDLRSSLRAYLFPVVKHRAISLLRKRRRVVPLSSERGTDSVPAPAWHGETQGDFGRLLAQLPEPQREVLRLRFALGLRLDEIAAALDIALGTVKSRLHNSLKKLRDNLGAGEASGA